MISPTLLLLLAHLTHARLDVGGGGGGDGWLVGLSDRQLYERIRHSNDCHLKLICTISKSLDESLKQERFMQGIRTLANRRKHASSLLLTQAIATGEAGADCGRVAPTCPQSEKDFLGAVLDMGISTLGRYKRQTEEGYYRPRRPASPKRLFPRKRRPFSRRPQTANRRQSFLSNLPPIVRPKGAELRQPCIDCDSRYTVCTVFGIGSWVGCTGAWLVAGFPGQIACNVATSPGSLACTANTFSCYMQQCGFLSIPEEIQNAVKGNSG